MKTFKDFIRVNESEVLNERGVMGGPFTHKNIKKAGNDRRLLNPVNSIIHIQYESRISSHLYGFVTHNISSGKWELLALRAFLGKKDLEVEVSGNIISTHDDEESAIKAVKSDAQKILKSF